MSRKDWSPADLGDKAYCYDINNGYRTGPDWRVLNEGRGPVTADRIEADKVTPESDAQVFPANTIGTDDKGGRYVGIDFDQASNPPSRIDTIGHNGGDGAHYDDPLYWRKRAENAEAELQRLREQEPVTWRYVYEDPFGSGLNVVSMNPRLNGCQPKASEPLYLAPVPPPDGRELAEALENFITHYRNGGRPYYTDCIKKAEAALAKFRGQS